MICATGVLSNEKKYGIVRRFQVSALSETKNFLGKFIPTVLTVTVGMLIVTVITALLYVFSGNYCGLLRYCNFCGVYQKER